MKFTATLITVLLVSSCSNTPCFNYAKVGVGYKFQETDVWSKTTGTVVDEPISARFELGQQCDAISYGVSHDSQWFAGAPFNNKDEYSKSEVFVDYMLKF